MHFLTVLECSCLPSGLQLPVCTSSSAGCTYVRLCVWPRSFEALRRLLPASCGLARMASHRRNKLSDPYLRGTASTALLAPSLPSRGGFPSAPCSLASRPPVANQPASHLGWSPHTLPALNTNHVSCAELKPSFQAAKHPQGP